MSKAFKNNEERFWANVQKGEGCWLWTAGKDRDGYGKFGVRLEKYTYKHTRAHRYSYVLVHGEIADGLFVLHKCDTPSCVRPDHLFLGTNEENTQDRHTKGRDARGERHWATKLNPTTVQEIRARYQPRVVSQRMLAREYGVCQATIKELLHGENWGYIK